MFILKSTVKARKILKKRKKNIQITSLLKRSLSFLLIIKLELYAIKLYALNLKILSV